MNGRNRPALAIKGLTKNYGDRPALEPLDLEIAVGEHVALVGHNGSGKTTMLKMVAGLLDPSGGSVRIAGHDAGSHRRPPRPVVAQRHADVLRRPVAVGAPRVRRPACTASTSGRPPPSTSSVPSGSPSDATTSPRRSAAACARRRRSRWPACGPFQVWLVDEPFVGLDESGKKALLGLFDEAAERGATLVVATHELTYVNRVGRLLALRDGAADLRRPTVGDRRPRPGDADLGRRR